MSQTEGIGTCASQLCGLLAPDPYSAPVTMAFTFNFTKYHATFKILFDLVEYIVQLSKYGFRILLEI